MNFILITSFLFATAWATSLETVDFQAIIDKVNSSPAKWKAGHNYHPTPVSHIRWLTGSHHSPGNLTVRSKNSLPNKALPKNFDARKAWPYCPTIRQIRDQGNCGCCWAIAAAEAFSDRYCIATLGRFTQPLSVLEVLTCCTNCGSCGGGNPISAWSFFMYAGLVTGGEYQSNIGCQPYTVPHCYYPGSHKSPQCADLPFPPPVPSCTMNCTNPSYNVDYWDDHHKAKSVYIVSNDPIEIQKEIYLHGPVEGTMITHEDFITYKSDISTYDIYKCVYHHVTGKELGRHAIKILGWGVEHGTPYWLVANSANEDWGDKGFFKILRGTNECNIESFIVAGEPFVNTGSRTVE